MTEAERLKAARKSLGLTTAEMADALQLRGANAKDDLRKMEDGARTVTGPVLVAAELMVAVWELIKAPDDAAEYEAIKRAQALLPEAVRG